MAGKEELALVKRDTVDVVADKIRAFQENGELHFPANYSPENAMKSAWLILQETLDKDSNCVLSSCTKDSIANSLLSMVVQGLNPMKKQCYFIAYGKQLTLMRSRFGNVYLAKLADSTIEDVIGATVYEGDEFEYEIRRGKYFVTKHVQKLQNIDKAKITAAYSTVLYSDGKPEYSNIMNFEQIKQAWKQSKLTPVDDKGNVRAGTTHSKFTSDMAERTVINATCKHIINNSNDSYLEMKKYYNQADDAIVDAEVAAVAEENANKIALDIDAETGEVSGPVDVDYKEQDAAEPSGNDLP